ncbi:UNVERIFIED_CONTAM: hypothetical protein GTU68_056408 [Idotea baltica]|nr:hypothetical protein [Idotea baltica]
MPLSSEQSKKFRSIGHHLKPVVIIAGNGLSESVLSELDRALNDHELIKVQLRVSDRSQRQELINELCLQTKATLVQSIGKMILIYRKPIKTKQNLSNTQRSK